MDTYYTADTHFGHEKIMEYEERPFSSVQEMDDTLINNWNSVVKPEDVVYHLGDVGLHKKERLREIVHSLNGTKICLRGNHDLKPVAMEKLGFLICLESAFIRIGRHDCYVSHEPFPMSSLECWMVHGHVHSKWKILQFERKICVSVENWKYTPVKEIDLISVMDKCDNSFGGSHG